MSQVIFLTCSRSPSQTGCSRNFANVRALGTSFRALSSGSLCRMSKERAENGQAWRFRRSAWWAGLCAIGRIGKASRVAGSSSPHYERSFRAPERSFSMKTSRSPIHDPTCDVKTGSLCSCARYIFDGFVLDGNGGVITRSDDRPARAFCEITVRQRQVMADPLR
jgi:hypothetical protein